LDGSLYFSSNPFVSPFALSFQGSPRQGVVLCVMDEESQSLWAKEFVTDGEAKKRVAAIPAYTLEAYDVFNRFRYSQAENHAILAFSRCVLAQQENLAQRGYCR